MTRIATYIFLAMNTLLLTYAFYLLGVKIGSSWYSAAPFYFVWCLIPGVLIHFGFTRFGASPIAAWSLMSSSIVTLLLSTWVVWTFFISGPIGPFSMLVFIPLPLTQFILVVPFLWLARERHQSLVEPGGVA